ncbi:uncharacterized protein LOC143211232 isoform X2 [Lasioglossum baleicum]|uniref:uncharacterized protein LOC143211232 isoform X2 n=1 Tax=Lasioglossum baleicum TaxID=434251 RepID=UPI003FCCDB8C
MVNCVFCGISRNNTKNVTFHRFPRDEPIRKEWLKIIGLEGLSVRNSTLLCSNHFTEDCFIVYFCNKKRVKLGSMPTILKKEARSRKQQDVLVETNCTGKAQDVATISDKENCEPQRNVLMETNSTDNDAGPASIIEQVPEASIIVEYSDSPTTSNKILSQEKCFSPNKTDAQKKKYRRITAHEIVSHDHQYYDTPCTLKQKLNALRIKYAAIVRKNKTLKQSVRRLKRKINSLEDVHV